MTETIDGVKIWQDGRAGRIALDRPAALNSLDRPMVTRLSYALDRFAEASSTVHLVVVEGAGGRAFCAGGDVRAMREVRWPETTSRSRASSARNTGSISPSRATRSPGCH